MLVLVEFGKILLHWRHYQLIKEVHSEENTNIFSNFNSGDRGERPGKCGPGAGNGGRRSSEYLGGRDQSDKQIFSD